MKTTMFLLAIILLSGCTRLEPNDCAVTGNFQIIKVERVGKHGGFEVITESCELGNWHVNNDGLTKTDCFDSFKHCEEKK